MIACSSSDVVYGRRSCCCCSICLLSRFIRVWMVSISDVIEVIWSYNTFSLAVRCARTDEYDTSAATTAWVSVNGVSLFSTTDKSERPCSRVGFKSVGGSGAHCNCTTTTSRAWFMSWQISLIFSIPIDKRIVVERIPMSFRSSRGTWCWVDKPGAEARDFTSPKETYNKKAYIRTANPAIC